MRVYVVGFAPANDDAALGGFDWFPSPGEAVARARRDLRQIGGLGNHSVTYVPLDVPNDVAYPGDQTVVDRDAVTSWIDANLHLVEVGLAPESPSDDDVPRYETLCIIYGCGEPADGEGPSEFSLPGGGRSKAHVCSGHREMLSENTLRGVSMSVPEAAAARVTRPSAILRRPDPETPISETTVAELLTEAIERASAMREQEQSVGGMAKDAFRVVHELSIFVTLSEDAITRHNKAIYLRRGVFAITDAERLPDGEDR